MTRKEICKEFDRILSEKAKEVEIEEVKEKVEKLANKFFELSLLKEEVLEEMDIIETLELDELL